MEFNIEILPHAPHFAGLSPIHFNFLKPGASHKKNVQLTGFFLFNSQSATAFKLATFEAPRRSKC